MSEFKAGDLVTHLTTKDILRVIGIEDTKRYYRFVKVKSLSPKNDGSVSDCFSALWFQLEFATKEEIKAGRRLP